MVEEANAIKKEKFNAESLSDDKIKEANISLVINNYIDIFSIFDPRPFSERAISVDFLDECRRAAINLRDSLELRILIPKDKRNVREEWKIKKRLREHFKHHYEIESKKIKSIKKEGILWVSLGIIVNAIVVSGILNFNNNLIHTILGIFEVPSWFLIWEGMGKIFLEAKEIQSEYTFYEKMLSAEINFTDY